MLTIRPSLVKLLPRPTRSIQLRRRPIACRIQEALEAGPLKSAQSRFIRFWGGLLVKLRLERIALVLIAFVDQLYALEFQVVVEAVETVCVGEIDVNARGILIVARDAEVEDC